MCPPTQFPKKKPKYCPPGTFDTEDTDTGELIEGRWRAEVKQDSGMCHLQNVPQNSRRSAKVIRNNFMKYFVSAQGKVYWQDKYA